ncbi:hypothetical protein EXU48_12775 [Occultella glacieicola]|uniref:Uncharacterized protein n=1 Tax=Occultella glacieicola TaxID=2518684 RepID=A0ABY2E3J9_9MICO|nr:hypothetical protein [Occultella glacieicola]TDE92438.1 hypothetical protein EXU48_12775 [Occultella glacieicola]
MSGHAEAMTERLPTLYRDGDLVRGLAEVIGLQLEILDSEARIVQRAHWFDATVERAEAAALGALLGIGAEPWQTLGEYRAWFHALRTARVRDGAVTGAALRRFVTMFAEAFERTNRLEALGPFDAWPPAAVRRGHAFVENPPTSNAARFGGDAAEPLTRQAVTNTGLDAADASILFTGTAVGEYVPVIVNLTTGEALVYLDAVGVGQRLWVYAGDDHTVTAELEQADVTHRMRHVRRVTPGTAWTTDDIGAETRALRLPPGDNDLWFLPVAHFDSPGLDRVLLALADLDLHQGRWDATTFDHALFYQDPGVVIDLTWTETAPAQVRLDLDAGTLLNDSGDTDAALLARAELDTSLGLGVRSLAAAGVRAEVRLRPLHDSQRQLDHLVFVSGRQVSEAGTVGIDRLRDAGGVYGVTGYGDSTYQ